VGQRGGARTPQHSAASRPVAAAKFAFIGPSTKLMSFFAAHWMDRKRIVGWKIPAWMFDRTACLSFGLQFENDDVIAVSARGAKALPESSLPMETADERKGQGGGAGG
jgi:hypothetical protein